MFIDSRPQTSMVTLDSSFLQVKSLLFAKWKVVRRHSRRRVSTTTIRTPTARRTATSVSSVTWSFLHGQPSTSTKRIAKIQTNQRQNRDLDECKNIGVFRVIRITFTICDGDKHICTIEICSMVLINLSAPQKKNFVHGPERFFGTTVCIKNHYFVTFFRVWSDFSGCPCTRWGGDS